MTMKHDDNGLVLSS